MPMLKKPFNPTNHWINLSSDFQKSTSTLSVYKSLFKPVLNKEIEDVHINLNDNNNIQRLPRTHDEVKKSLQTIISSVNN
jgi:hypothetical protein